LPEHLLFLTGRPAEKSLHRVLESMQPAPFSHTVHVLSIQVAGLMTSDMIRALPPWRALILRAGCPAPVVAKLARAWKAREYKRARRQRWAVAPITAATPPALADLALPKLL